MTTKNDLWHRLPKELRAGTLLDWRADNVIEIWGPAYHGALKSVVHGYLDQRQRVYQSGGELKNFKYWKEHLMSVEYGIWVQIRDRAAWIELIDHELNQCYRIAMTIAQKAGWVYDGGIGPRWGVPDHLWSKSSGPEPDRPDPSPGPNAPTEPDQGRLL